LPQRAGQTRQRDPPAQERELLFELPDRSTQGEHQKAGRGEQGRQQGQRVQREQMLSAQQTNLYFTSKKNVLDLNRFETVRNAENEKS
jgi:hypothetical protein